MKASSILAVVPLLSLACATVKLDFVAKRGFTSRRDTLVGHDNGDDADETSLPQDAAYTRYFANVSIGEPGQIIQLHVDTGSSDVWVIANDADVTPDPADYPQGTPGGTFDLSASTTASEPFIGGLNISYLDGSGAYGDLFTDTLAVAGSTLTNFTIGLAHKASMGRGILGLGFPIALSFIGNPNIAEERKLTLLDSMVDDEQITSQGFSLWLNDVDSSSGAIVFGGIDTKKYNGTLASLSMYPTPGQTDFEHPLISFTSLAITTPSGSQTLTPDDYAYPAILDSGTTVTVVPDFIANAIYAQTGAVYFSQYGVAAVPCGVRDVAGTLDFGFGGPNGPIIKVPIGDLIFPAIFAGQPVAYPNSTQMACQFGINPSSTRGLPDGYPVPFGDSMMRSAYIAYDYANKRIALAQTIYNVTDEDVVKFESPGAPIPSATTVSNERVFNITTMVMPPAYTAPTFQFTGSIGSAFAAAYTGDVATITQSIASAMAGEPTTSSTSTDSSKPTTTLHNAAVSGPIPAAWGQLSVLGVAISLFATGGDFFL
ncbi:aspartic peptidase domain-containing protein [Calycina marina]|uniref:Aspartic peptidase domain-containing protein n=1 Tax=Calycina marina TaxID=1763456 RepID=A0A9P7Z0R9_9HELO|nr:aspartic peptidase domain-containing protein [Calycina marina]